MNNDLISREALRRALHKRIIYFDKSSWDEVNALLNDAPTVCDEDPAIPTFNREELEKARDYWYNHLEVGNEKQNEAAWAAINAIKYCIEHSSGYQKGVEND